MRNSYIIAFLCSILCKMGTLNYIFKRKAGEEARKQILNTYQMICFHDVSTIMHRIEGLHLNIIKIVNSGVRNYIIMISIITF